MIHFECAPDKISFCFIIEQWKIPHKRDSIQVQEIQYIVNPLIEKEFETMMNEAGGQVLFGFHGTRESNIKHICKENFRLSRYAIISLFFSLILNCFVRCKSLTQFGEAIWFSMDPLQALMYVPDDKKTKKLILAKIITGCSYKGTTPPLLTFLFHSTHHSLLIS